MFVPHSTRKETRSETTKRQRIVVVLIQEKMEDFLVVVKSSCQNTMSVVKISGTCVLVKKQRDHYGRVHYRKTIQIRGGNHLHGDNSTRIGIDHDTTEVVAVVVLRVQECQREKEEKDVVLANFLLNTTRFVVQMETKAVAVSCGGGVTTMRTRRRKK